MLLLADAGVLLVVHFCSGYELGRIILQPSWLLTSGSINHHSCLDLESSKQRSSIWPA